MKLYIHQFRLFFILSCVSRLLTAPIADEKKTSKCSTVNGATRSSVDTSSVNDKKIHLLADLEALSHGIKRALAEDDCDVTGNKKDQLGGKSTGSEAGNKKDFVNVIQETPVINDQESIEQTGKAAKIVETGKSALRSNIGNNSTDKEKSTAVSKQTVAPKENSKLKEEKKGDETAEKKSESIKKPDPSETSAKTFIARSKEIASSKEQVNAIHKSNIDKTLSKVKTDVKPDSESLGIHRVLHTSALQSSSPSPQKGTLSTNTHVNAERKSSTNIITPLNNAIKSLDSATKLLGAVTTGKVGSTATSTSSKSSSSITPSDKAAVVPKINLAGNKTVVEDASTRTSSASPAAKAADSTAAKAPAKDPYAEIANGPDSPKTPELKTGSDKAGLPVMKIDPGASAPEPVSFAKDESDPQPAPMQSSAPGRPGPQDVGGILDKLTDKLNKGGSAIEQPLPPHESKEIVDQLTQYDSDALATAKGWESNGLKALEKLKTAEFRHGSMKNELSKELTDRLAEDQSPGLEGNPNGFAAAGAGSPLAQDIGGEDIPSDLNGLGSRESFGHQLPAQWPEMNSLDSLDTEAQREESPYSVDRSMGEGFTSQGTDPSLSPDSNAYDRQEIASYLNSDVPRDNGDMGSDQGQYYKRSIILKPLYYYYHHLPYAFKHPYDD